MNPAAVIALMSATCSMLLTLTWLFLSRAPGWEDTRPLSLASATAALYSLFDFTRMMPVSDEVALWAGQAGIAAATLYAGAGLLFVGARDRHRLSNLEQVIAGSGVLLAVLTLLPGVLFTGRLSVFSVSWLDVTYRAPQHKALSTVALFYFVGVLGSVATRASRRWSEGWRWRAPLLGGVLLFALGLNDALTVSRVIGTPLLLDLGFLVVNVTYGVTELSRLVGDARRLELLSAQLEGEVQARTNELTSMQHALARAEKLAAIGRLAGGVAHELNNPTAVVLSNLGYVRSALLEGVPMPEDAVDALEDASAATERIAHVVRDLSDAGRVASRCREQPEKPCEIDEVLRRAFENVRPAAGALVPKQVGLTGAKAHFDETLLERVLQSLLHNAVAAVEGHPMPEVTVEVGRTTKDVQLIVRDNGPGVASAAEPRLFEPFFTTRPHGQGKGLGLAVAKGLMHSQGGDLRFLGNSPSGAQFILTLPASMREGES